MADQKISQLTTIPSVDGSADFIPIVDTSGGSTNKVTRNGFLDITSHPTGNDDTQTLTNKTLTTPTLTVNDNVFTIRDNADTTKLLQFQLSGITTGTTRTLTIPDVSDTLVTLTATQTLTNKTLTSPTINTATIVNPTLTTDTISEYSSAAGVTIDGVLLKDAKMNGSYITDSTVAHTQLANGAVVQVISSVTGAVATGTTVIPQDDTIPQITEGTEFITLAITPKSTTNILIISVSAYFAASTAGNYVGGGLFQDATASALAAGEAYADTANAIIVLSIQHRMVAGTTSSTTFRLRAGPRDAATVTFNGASSARRFGGVMASSIVITEYKA